MTTEEWRPIPGSLGFEVSDQGRVRSLTRTRQVGNHTRTYRERIRQLAVNRSGYPEVNINGHARLVHQLVLSAFVGPRPQGLVTCHNNGDPADNRLENLRYDTQAANVRDTVRHGNNHSARKAACPQGHPYTSDNIVIGKRGSGATFRICKTCHRLRSRRSAACGERYAATHAPKGRRL